MDFLSIHPAKNPETTEIWRYDLELS